MAVWASRWGNEASELVDFVIYSMYSISLEQLLQVYCDGQDLLINRTMAKGGEVLLLLEKLKTSGAPLP